jgi:hypothetical protein
VVVVSKSVRIWEVAFLDGDSYVGGHNVETVVAPNVRVAIARAISRNKSLRYYRIQDIDEVKLIAKGD